MSVKQDLKSGWVFLASHQACWIPLLNAILAEEYPCREVLVFSGARWFVEVL